MSAYPESEHLPSDETVAVGVVPFECAMHYNNILRATSTSSCCRGRAASDVVTLLFCQNKPASAFFV